MYTKNYKTLIKERAEHKQEDISLFMDWKI